MGIATAWHEATLRQLHDLLAADPAVELLAVVGSGAGARLDDWSDLDVLLVVTPAAFDRYFPSLAWLAPLGRLYAAEQHPGAHHAVSRVCFDDLRRLDLVVTTGEALAREADRPNLPLAGGSRVLFSRSPAGEAALAGSPAPAPPPAGDEAFAALANGFWFRGVVAVQKVVRGDLLVALHLSLGLIQDCLVLAMLLRDRATGTTQHRGGVGDHFVAELEPTRRPHTAAGVLDAIEQSAAAFDRLGAQWTAAYRERRHPLLAWVASARLALAAAERPRTSAADA